ncbi:MAG: tRNA preQ1(34) S-adenosylmethionine ribosyltransferase-isomerase QueA [Gammaproteobacteria bacterium]|nr:MAG: tRNA preQ1(34) S-adenosylmethionine ribosyltransferase-isomerase QueA [Gammaproteobacteria bacterium]
MHTSDFHYDLPAERIARYPADPRTACRMLLLDGARGECRDLRFTDLASLLKPSDLLVFNDTRVIPARLFGAKDTGGRIEVLVERVLDAHRALAQVRASKPPKPGGRLDLEGGVTAHVVGRQDEFYELEFESPQSVIELLERAGHMPLPPYIARTDEPADRENYQTVFARQPGAVAAPTAGLHFDDAMLERLKAMGVEFGWLTLHVGAGTFQPVRSENIEEHRMHAERLTLDATLCAQVNAAKAAGRRVVAVGTTAVRALEAVAARGWPLTPWEGETDIFIYPGYRFRVVDALLTNFHLPGSTLLMLVCAFGGTEAVLSAYRHAVADKYRFYSYGDAMFVLPSPTVSGR